MKVAKRILIVWDWVVAGWRILDIAMVKMDLMMVGADTALPLIDELSGSRRSYDRSHPS
jgi:hypothetical protein